MGDRVRRSVVTVVAGVVVAVAGGAGAGAWHLADIGAAARSRVAAIDAQEADRAGALAAGARFLATAYTVDVAGDKTMAKWNAAMTAATVDTLKEQVRQTKAMLSMLTEAGAGMTGTVTESAVISQNDTLLRIVAVVRLTGSAPGQAEPTTGSVTEYVDLMKVNGEWKVFGYKDIGSTGGAGAPAAGLPGLPVPAK
ncbi:hypothetical protein ABZ319_36165 [Nocardia sp. NPDC005978]|uniref:hypothetical protein n=1 Tax=Nocardia sp. NPDC005978 TaxID=3156725 RepID=UPI0033A28096